MSLYAGIVSMNNFQKFSTSKVYPHSAMRAKRTVEPFRIDIISKYKRMHPLKRPPSHTNGSHILGMFQCALIECSNPSKLIEMFRFIFGSF